MSTRLSPSLQYQEDPKAVQASTKQACSRPTAGTGAHFSRVDQGPEAEDEATHAGCARPQGAHHHLAGAVGGGAAPSGVLEGDASLLTGAPLSADNAMASLLGSDEPQVAELATKVWQAMQAIANDKRMTVLAALIEDRHSEADLRLDAVCTDLKMCEESLNRKLKALTGMTFHQLLARYRLLTALSIMLRTGQGAGQAAEDAGFEWRRSLEKCCARFLGGSPAALRDRMSSKESSKATSASGDPN